MDNYFTKLGETTFSSSERITSWIKQRITSLRKLFGKSPAESTRESTLGGVPNRALTIKVNIHNATINIHFIQYSIIDSSMVYYISIK
jgi:hypothetical protein